MAPGLGGRLGISKSFIISLAVPAAYSVIDIDPSLRRLSLNLRSADGRGGMVGALAGGLTAVLAIGLAFGLTAVPLGGLAFGLRRNFSLATQPTTVMRQNLRYVLAIVLAIGLMIALVIALLTGLVGRMTVGVAGRITVTSGLAGGLTGGLAIWLAFGMAGALASGLTVWIRYAIGCVLARRKGLLPSKGWPVPGLGLRGQTAAHVRNGSTVPTPRTSKLAFWGSRE